MKIFDFFRKYMGKMVGAGAEIFDKLEPEPKFLTSWSRSRTKMDRLRNTGPRSKFLLLASESKTYDSGRAQNLIVHKRPNTVGVDGFLN
jgi:hypothetical protein